MERKLTKLNPIINSRFVQSKIGLLFLFFLMSSLPAFSTVYYFSLTRSNNIANSYANYTIDYSYNSCTDCDYVFDLLTTSLDFSNVSVYVTVNGAWKSSAFWVGNSNHRLTISIGVADYTGKSIHVELSNVLNGPSGSSGYNEITTFGTSTGAHYYQDYLSNMNLPATYAAPGTPATPTASSITSSSFYVSWGPSSSGTYQPAPDEYLLTLLNSSNVPIGSEFTTGTGRSYTFTGLSAGTIYKVRVRAHSSYGYSNYIYSGNITTSSQVAQTITFNALPAKTYGDADFSPGATASSGLTVTYSSSNTAVATIVSNQIHIVGTGTATIYANQAGNGSYQAAPQKSQTLTVNKKNLTVTGATVTKEYDGTTNAVITSATLNGIINSDAVSITSPATGVYASALPATGITVTPALTLTGTKAANYTLIQPTITNGEITVKTLTVSGAVAQNKPYDGNTAAAISGATLVGKVGAEDVTLVSASTGTFASSNKGDAISVTTNMIIEGADITHYTLTQPTLLANITAKELTVSGAVAANKVYDGNTATVISGATLEGVVGSEDVTLVNATTGTFASRNVASGISVVPTMTIEGVDIDNYSFTQPALSADITAKTLVVTTTATDKVYDATSVAATTLSDDRVSGDDLILSKTSSVFNNKNVGDGKTVTVSGIYISGTDAGNYVLGNITATTTANITQKALTITASGVNKEYDGNATATVALSDDRVSGDSFIASYTTATFPDKLIGTGKTVSISGITISGTDAANYSFNTTASTSADITAKTLTVTPSADDKEYDGNTTATVSLDDNRISGDEFTVSNTTATFNNKNVGIGKTVTVSGISISGTDAGNYTVATTATTTADITAKTLVVTTTATDKVYDATAAAATTLADDRVSGDNLTLSKMSSVFDDENVGTGKTVTVSGISKSGTDAGNYVLGNVTATTTANINQKVLTILASGVNKEYDGNATATVTLSDDRVLGDSFTANYTTATFPDKLIGTEKTISVSGITISGTDAANYSFNTTASTLADITAKKLTINATGINKVYDQNATATVTLGDDRVSGDELTTSYTTAEFADKFAATGKTVTVGGISISGTDAGNYTFNAITITTADITPRPLNVTATAQNKEYDGNTTAVVTLLDDRIPGDVLTSTYTSATFSDKHADTEKTVTISGISISGTDAKNYAPNPTITASADIAYKILTITGSNGDKVYDGTTNAIVTLNDNRVTGDNLTITYASAKFSDKFVGTAKKITVSGISISGDDAQDYMTNNTVKFNANIAERPVTVTGISVSDKIYDATTTADLSGGTLSGVISGDDVSLTLGIGVFADKNAGNDKPVVTSGYSIGGASVANYVLAEQPTGVTGTVLQKEVTVEGVTASNKVYDGTTVASLSGGTISGAIDGDDVTIVAGTGDFANKFKGADKSVTARGYSLSGADGANYKLTAQPLVQNADITGILVSITGVTASDKIYDGTAVADLSGGTLSGVIDGDDVSIVAGTGVFEDVSVGTGKTVTATGYSITGADAENYTLSAQPDIPNANITQKMLTITADDKSKEYDGTVYSPFTVSYDGFVVGEDKTDLSGTLSFTGTAAAATNVGTAYVITSSGLTSSNYDITFANGELDITAKTLTIIADDKTKEYDGAAFIPFTVTYDGFVNGEDKDDLGGTLSFTGMATTAVNVGEGYVITPEGLTSSNYAIAFENGELDITEKPITVTADAGQNKIYGESDGTFTYTFSPALVSGDVFTGTLTRETGENVGSYPIEIGMLSAGSNYTITFESDDYSITEKPVTVTADTNQTKVYGETDRVYTYTFSPALVSGDTFTGALSREPGENVGTYAIEIGTLSAGSNYTTTFVSNDYNVTEKPITVTANANQTKTYGETDGVFTYSVSPAMVSGDAFTGALSRETGENVGSYSFEIGTLSAGSNYTTTFVSDNYRITEKPITVTADASQSKIYGEPDGVFTYSVSPVLVSGDSFTGALSREAGENVGTYAIEIGTLSAGSNYTTTFVSDNYSINEKPITVTADASQSKIYGESDGVLTYSVSPALVSGDAFTGALSRESGENVGTYAIEIGTLSAGSNYTITFGSDNYSITEKPVTVTANAGQTKVYGEADGVFTYTFSPALVSGDAFTGALARESGENVGSYALEIGTLSAGSNYTTTFVSDDYSITEKPITVTADANQSKIYGEPDDTFTYLVSPNLVSGDAFIGTLSRETGENVGMYAIEIGTLSAGSNYTTRFVSDDYSITEKALTITADNKIKIYDGTVYSPFTVTYDGFVVGEDETALGGMLSFSGTAATAVNVGEGYVIIPEGLTSTNYAIAFKNGELDITKSVQAITFATLESKVFGDAAFDLTATASSGLPVSYSSSNPAVATVSGATVTIAGVGDATITASQPGDVNYDAASPVTQQLVVFRYVAGDTSRDGKITPPEVAGDTNGDGKIDGSEIAGDKDGDGKIGDGEIAGDLDGDGKITPPEVAGDTNGDGKIGDGEVSGDKDGDGKVTTPEIAGDNDGDGKITQPEVAGDKDGDGKIDGSEIAGDTDGDGKITPPEVAGDINGDGKITSPEVLGDTNGDGKIENGEIAGDSNGDGKIGNGETAGNTGGTDSGIAGDINGDGKITPPEVAGDTNGDGKIDDGEVSGDKDGDGKITTPEIAGDNDGDGKITQHEIAGDKDGDGKIDGSEIAGDTDGDGKITPPEVAGDINGDGKITSPEVLGDTNGDGKIENGEIAGDSNGDGKITPPEIAGDKDGDGKIDGSEIAGDTDGDGKITPPEVAGDTNGDGTITSPEILGDTNGDGKIGNGEIAGDANGDGKIGNGETAGNTGGTGSGIAGDINGDGKITPPEIAGDLNGDGKITAPEIAGDTNGDGKITSPEVLGDTNGDGKIGNGEIAGDANGDGKIGNGETAGNTGGTDSGIAGDTNGNGRIDDGELAGDTNGDGKITVPEVLGDTNGDGKINDGEIAGDANGDGIIGEGESRVIDPEKDHINVDHLFSPNGDGINDYWKLRDIDKMGRVYVKIYDRWGNILYETTNYQNDWDGTSNGKQVPEGAYVYFVKTEKAGTKTGVINIVR